MLIAEILPPSKRRDDLGIEPDAYKRSPSVQKVLLVDSGQHWVQVWSRDGAAWRGIDPVGEAVPSPPAIGITLPLGALCRGTGL